MIELKLCPVCGAAPKLSAIMEKDGIILPERMLPEGATFHSGKYLCSGCALHISVGDWESTIGACTDNWNKRVERYEREQEADYCPYCEENSDGFIKNVCFDHEDKHISFSAFDGNIRAEFIGFESIGIEDCSRFQFPVRFCPFCGKEFSECEEGEQTNECKT